MISRLAARARRTIFITQDTASIWLPTRWHEIQHTAAPYTRLGMTDANASRFLQPRIGPPPSTLHLSYASLLSIYYLRAIGLHAGQHILAPQ